MCWSTTPGRHSGAAATTGAMVVEPYLRHRGRRRIDLLVVSHDDVDHAGGAGSVARLLPVQRLVASGRVLDPLGAVERCHRGVQWTWDGVSFEWLHPAMRCDPRTTIARACCWCAPARTRSC